MKYLPRFFSKAHAVSGSNARVVHRPRPARELRAVVAYANDGASCNAFFLSAARAANA